MVRFVSYTKATPRHLCFARESVIAMTEAELLAIRLHYEAAYDAYRACVRALAGAGRPPSRHLLVSEANALRELSEARARYRSALLQVASAAALIH